MILALVVAAWASAPAGTDARQPERGPSTVRVRRVEVVAGQDAAALVKKDWAAAAVACAAKVRVNVSPVPSEAWIRFTTDEHGKATATSLPERLTVYHACFEDALAAVTWPAASEYAIRVLVGSVKAMAKWQRPVSVRITGGDEIGRSQSDHAARCYRKFVPIDDFLKGTITVTLTIQDGKATSSKASGLNTAVDKCVANVARSWVPQGAPDGELIMTVELEGK